MARRGIDWRDPWSKITVGVVGLVFCGLLYRTRLAEHATVSWDVRVDGRVTEVDAWAHGSRGGYQLWFEYTLEDGRTGRGVWNPGGERISPVEALSFESSYPVGSRIAGWANPANPVEAVVRRGPEITRPGVAAAIFGVLGLILTVGVVQAFRRRAARHRARAAGQAAFDAMMDEVRAHKARGGRVRVRERNRGR